MCLYLAWGKAAYLSLLSGRLIRQFEGTHMLHAGAVSPFTCFGRGGRITNVKQFTCMHCMKGWLNVLTGAVASC
jgi:hypothetical protein